MLRIPWSFPLAFLVPLVLCLLAPMGVLAQDPGERPALSGLEIRQADIAAGELRSHTIRRTGGLIFSTPFTKLDGYGHGLVSTYDAEALDTRPTLQGNGTFLRVNGLDAQSCLECHAVLSNAVVPFQSGVGGVGAGSANALALPSYIEVALSGKANFDGRFINPPFVFGAGGIELLAKEMTRDLQRLKSRALRTPRAVVALVTKGVSFGSLVCQANGECDTTRVEGIDADLVVRPFGRKGQFSTVRAFAVGAMEFHFGMQPMEVVGAGVDADGDGVVNEVSIGQMSALHIFSTTLPPPEMAELDLRAQKGQELFEKIGCADCHVPVLSTESPILTYSFPEMPTHPRANVFYGVNLLAYPSFFEESVAGGLMVPLFADLKRHDMGPGLAESFGGELASQFTTARLWGVADTAPYLHDGRALTLTDAIRLHGGEAQAARDTFLALRPHGRKFLLAFLRALRTPNEKDVAPDLKSDPEGDQIGEAEVPLGLYRTGPSTSSG